MYPESTQSLLNVHRAFWLCLKSVFAFCMVEGIMPPANLHGESTPDFIVRMYIECTFEFIEACLREVKKGWRLVNSRLRTMMRQWTMWRMKKQPHRYLIKFSLKTRIMSAVEMMMMKMSLPSHCLQSLSRGKINCLKLCEIH